MSDSDLKALFIKVLEDIKKSKKLGFATVARLINISTTKIYNIKNEKSTPKKEDLQKLLVKFPEYQHLFSHIEDLDLSALDKKYESPEKDIISILNDKLALYEETKTAQRETIESLKSEIQQLREKLALQEKLLAAKKKK